MKTNLNKNIGILIGVIGSLMGFYIWKDYIPDHINETQNYWLRILRLEYLIFLFIPSSIALISSVFKKTHLMYLAILLSLPTIKYLGVKPIIFPDTFPLVYFPLIFYFISALFLSSKKTNIKKKGA